MAANTTAQSDALIFNPNKIEVNLSAIEENLYEIKRNLDPKQKIIAVIKANAYGNGATMIASTLARCGVDFLAAGCLQDEIAVRDAEVGTPIILLGSLYKEAIDAVLKYRLIPTLDQGLSAEALSNSAVSPTPVFVKIDCGFGRFGVSMNDAIAFVEHVSQLKWLSVQGVYTHLPFYDEQGRIWAEERTKQFEGLVSRLASRGIVVPIIQSQASPGVAARASHTATAVAVGHLLYGLVPIRGDLWSADASCFRPALRAIKARLIHAGDSLGGEAAAPYLRQHCGRIGVVSIGIHHGYRPISAAAYMLVRGRPAPILRVCLENTIVDLGSSDSAEVGDDVIVVGTENGSQIALEDLAKWQSTSPLALLTALGHTLSHHYA
jgi:alanine racemase